MRLTSAIEGPALELVHPHASRRLGGVAASIDLTPDHACNYRCVYCNVEGLVDVKAKAVDVDRIEAELRRVLAALASDAGRTSAAPEGQRELRAVLLSGSGEPTLSFEFLPVVQRVHAVLDELGLAESVRPILLTNGTNVNNRKVREALELMAARRGEVWFKLDTATKAGMQAVHNSNLILRQIRENMRVASKLCPTRIQTCLFLRDGAPWDEKERSEYLAFLALQKKARVELAGVQLYTLAAASAQPEAAGIAPVPPDQLEALAADVRALEIPVEIFS
jgi:wyosine [tRNA(Phe)-imidazoG37] synthetase (radical SAM superfamily)